MTSVRVPMRRALPFKRDLISRIALLLVALLLVVAIVGPHLPLGNGDAIGAGPRLAAPSSQFPLGTDELGRSLLPRVVQGLGTTFLLAAIAVCISAAISLLLGLFAATGPVRSGVISRAVDVVFSFPPVLLAILIVAIIGPGETSAVVAIVLVTAPLMTRVVRAAALGVAVRDFVTAARVSGASQRRLMAVHVLPNVAGPFVVQVTFAFSLGILVESTLSFLGLGVRPPMASLGSLVYDGVQYLQVAPWLVYAPGALLALTIIAVNLLGDGVRDAFEVDT
jgi:peptide/nickel transport system permease protein